MPSRRRLSNRRFAETFELEVGGLRYKVTAGYFPDGSLAELFLNSAKPSSQADVNARDASVAASLALQFGCPLEVLQRALLRDAQGRASSPLGAALDHLVADAIEKAARS
jgi:hypothetical protein